MDWLYYWITETDIGDIKWNADSNSCIRLRLRLRLSPHVQNIVMSGPHMVKRLEMYQASSAPCSPLNHFIVSDVSFGPWLCVIDPVALGH